MKTDTKGHGEAATLEVGRTQYPHLELETEIMRACAVLELIGSDLAERREACGGELAGSVAGGLIALVHDTQRSLRTSYDRAHEEWAALRNAPRNN